jgi:hypothetical protein
MGCCWPAPRDPYVSLVWHDFTLITSPRTISITNRPGAEVRFIHIYIADHQIVIVPGRGLLPNVIPVPSVINEAHIYRGTYIEVFELIK